jgi:hypothetical protein
MGLVWGGLATHFKQNRSERKERKMETEKAKEER